jgi:dTDP-glucose 4,6-dehydratase
MAYHRYHGLDTHIARIFNTFGPRMRLDDGRVVPNFICQALDQKPLTLYGDGSQTRSFCYVDDLVEGLYRLLFSDYNQPVNLGNPYEMTIRELAEVVNRLTDNPAEMINIPDGRAPADPQQRQPDIGLAKEVLDWHPVIELEEGLEKTIADFKARRS